jgi:hypothetical protein
LLTTTALSPSQTTSQPVTDLEILERSIKNVIDMLDRVLAYVRDVLSGKSKGDPVVGRYLMDTLGGSTDDLEKGGFNASLQVGVLFYKFAMRLILVSPLESGYVDGFVPRKSRTIASGNFFPASPRHAVM